MAMDLKRAETHLRRARIRAEGAAVKISNQFRAQAIVDAVVKRIPEPIQSVLQLMIGDGAARHHRRFRCQLRSPSPAAKGPYQTET